MGINKKKNRFQNIIRKYRLIEKIYVKFFMNIPCSYYLKSNLFEGDNSIMSAECNCFSLIS